MVLNLRNLTARAKQEVKNLNRYLDEMIKTEEGRIKGRPRFKKRPSYIEELIDSLKDSAGNIVFLIGTTRAIRAVLEFNVTPTLSIYYKYETIRNNASRLIK